MLIVLILYAGYQGIFHLAYVGLVWNYNLSWPIGIDGDCK